MQMHDARASFLLRAHRSRFDRTTYAPIGSFNRPPKVVKNIYGKLRKKMKLNQQHELEKQNKTRRQHCRLSATWIWALPCLASPFLRKVKLFRRY
jgi:hypothetical protein